MERLRKDRCRLRATPVLPTKGLRKKILLLPLELLLLLLLLLHPCIVLAMQIVHAPLIRVGQCFVRSRDALEARAGVWVLVFIWMILLGGIPVRSFDVSIRGSSTNSKLAIKIGSM